MVYSVILVAIIFVFPGLSQDLAAFGKGASCSDSLLIENPVNIESYGIDTTGHWWAIIRPYEKWKSLIVDGISYGPYEEISKPFFSRVGTDWVSIASSDVRWWLIGPNRSLRISGIIDAVHYPRLTEEIWWIERVGEDRILTNGTRKYSTGFPITDVEFDPQGIIISWVEKKLNQYCLFRNGEAIGCYDSVLLGGVWYDGRILSAQKSGKLWTVMLGDEALTTNLSEISSIQLNVFGQVGSWSVTETGDINKVYVYRDDFRNPWESHVLQDVDSVIALHPYDPLVAFKATVQGRQVVLYNSAEYPQGTISTSPVFSNDGETMVYASYQDDNYIVVNGRRQLVNAGVPKSKSPAINHRATHVAWPSRTTIVVYDLVNDILTMGKMCDEVSDVVYDSRDRSFKALAIVSQKLYLLQCKPN